MKLKQVFEWKHVFFVGLLVVIVVYYFSATSARGPKPLVVVSGDQGLTLEIDKGALPEGVAKESISIEPYGADELSSLGTEGKLVGYKLLPDGLVFKKPIRVTMNYRTDKTGIFPILHMGKEGTEWLDGVRYDLRRDATGGMSVSATAAISHFSGVVRDERDFFQLATQNGPRYFLVGQKVPFRFSITPTGNAYERRTNLPGKTVDYAMDENSIYRVNVDRNDVAFVSEKRKISPDTPVPFGEKRSPEPYVLTQELTCDNLGKDVYRTLGMIGIEYVKHLSFTEAGLIAHSSTSTGYVYFTYSDEYECGAPEPTRVKRDTFPPDVRKVDVVVVGDKTYIVDSLTAMSEHYGCTESHWHANNIATAKTLSGEEVPDPDIDGCGFGTMSAHPIQRVPDTR